MTIGELDGLCWDVTDDCVVRDGETEYVLDKDGVSVWVSDVETLYDNVLLGVTVWIAEGVVLVVADSVCDDDNEGICVCVKVVVWLVDADCAFVREDCNVEVIVFVWHTVLVIECDGLVLCDETCDCVNEAVVDFVWLTE